MNSTIDLRMSAMVWVLDYTIHTYILNTFYILRIPFLRCYVFIGVVETSQ